MHLNFSISILYLWLSCQTNWCENAFLSLQNRSFRKFIIIFHLPIIINLFYSSEEYIFIHRDFRHYTFLQWKILESLLLHSVACLRFFSFVCQSVSLCLGLVFDEFWLILVSLDNMAGNDQDHAFLNLIRLGDFSLSLWPRSDSRRIKVQANKTPYEG